MDSIDRLFGSSVRTKLMRLFLFNPEQAFNYKTLSLKLGTAARGLKKELSLLERADLIKKKSVKGKQRTVLYSLNSDWEYKDALFAFFAETTYLSDKSITSILAKAGKPKLVIASGIFMGEGESRIDLLIVGDTLKKGALEKGIHELELAMGRELRYSVFTVADFKYRLGLYDKLIRDVIDYPHRVVLDRMGNLLYQAQPR